MRFELQGFGRGSCVTVAQVWCHSDITPPYSSTVDGSKVGSRKQNIQTRNNLLRATGETDGTLPSMRTRNLTGYP
eukprot:1194140-Prorocentrum_minimum.AAC.1